MATNVVNLTVLSTYIPPHTIDNTASCTIFKTKFAKLMFLQVSVCQKLRDFMARGACVVLFRGACVVLFRGACMVLFGGHAWFYLGGHAWFYLGGMRGFIRGACVVLFGGHVWFYSGGMRGFIWGACVVLFRGGVHGFFSFFGYNEIRSMSCLYACYWNAFLFKIQFPFFSVISYIRLLQQLLVTRTWTFKKSHQIKSEHLSTRYKTSY